MNLGLSGIGNNWKLIVGNFLIMFLTQIAFRFDGIINSGSYPTEIEWIKMFSNSLIVTLIFYGFNRLQKEK